MIDILVEINWLDKELYQEKKGSMVRSIYESLRAVYINQKRPVPTRQDIYRDSTCRSESIVENSI